MKKATLIIITLILISIASLGQQYTIVLDTVLTGTQSIVAKDAIFLSPGFQYTASVGQSFDASINSQLEIPAYSPGNQVIDTLNRNLDHSLKVGTLPGDLDVTALGAATYQIPIFISPGTAGMQPGISIVYNSQGKEGLLGKGWDIAGLSEIRRVPQNFYIDNKVEGVSLTSNDRFALDSNRLILKTGTYGADASTYGTEYETFVKVVAHETAGNGPSWFEVYAKDGRILEYGHSTDSKVEVYGGTTVYMWRLNKCYDRSGNTIKFTYNEVNGESYISHIDYTTNDAAGLTTPYNSIIFDYASRNDQNSFYVAGYNIPTTKILTQIKMQSEGNQVRKYQFKYYLDSFNKTRLNEIVEYGSDATYLNSTLIGWGATTSNFSSQNSSFLTSQINAFYYGDFNGDGRKDFLVTEKKTSFTSSDKWQLYLAGTDGITFTKKNEGYLASTFGGFFIADVDGNGRDEALWKVKGSTISFLNYSYIENTGLVRGDTAYDLTFNTSDAGLYIIPGDFDGDGKPDYLALYANNTFFAVKINGVNKSGMSFTTPDDVRLVDFDGDGRKEVQVITGNNCYIYQYSTTNQTFSTIYSSTTFPTSSDRIFTGDFNGDKKTDILSWKSGTGWSMKFSTGSSFDAAPSTPAFYNADPNASLLDFNYYVGDMNGDGFDDVIEIYKNASASQIKVYYSLGNGGYITQNNAYTKSAINQDYFTTGDFNGDGKMDLFYYDNSLSTNLVNICFFHKDELPDYVNLIANGLNFKTRITYRRLNDNPYTGYGWYYYVWYTDDAVFPVYDYYGPYYAVNIVKTDNGLGGYSTNVYNWEGVKIHRQGKGFLGFSKIIQSDEARNFQSYYVYGLDTQFYYMSLIKSFNWSWLSGIPHDTLSVQYITNSVQDFGNKRIWPYVSQSKAINKKLQTNTLSYFYYDVYGNNYKTKTITSNDETGGSIERIKTISNTFNSYGTYDNVLNKVIKSIDSTTYTGETPYFRVKSFMYDSFGRLTADTLDPNKAKAVTTIYTYPSSNNFGLPIQTTVRAAGVTDRTTTFEYDAKSRFITKITDPEGGYVSKTYFAGTGNINTETSYDNLTTTYTYDGFGRLIDKLTPQGNHVTISYLWDNSYSGGSYSVYYVNTDATDQPYINVYFDLLGRKINTKTEKPGGISSEEITYNAAGQVIMKDLPHFFPESAKYETYTYDEYGRLKTSFYQHLTEYSYYGKTDSIKFDIPQSQGGNAAIGNLAAASVMAVSEPESYFKIIKRNSLGDIVYSNDLGSVVTTTYYSNGQPKQMDADGTVVNFYYDEYGRQTSIVNPNSGTTSYHYNALAELTYQKDANNKTDSLQYDNLGRITRKISQSGNTDYAYVQSGNGKGQIQSITGTTGISESYTYDSYGRAIQVANSIPSDQGFTTSFTYDTWNNNTSITYPSGIVISNIFNNGYLKEIKQGTSSIWKLDSINGLGQPMRFTLGGSSILRPQFSYDWWGNLIGKSYFPGNNQTYSYDTLSGNILSRSYITKGISQKNETFSYDSKFRLTTSSIDIHNGVTILYDNHGNITSKDLVGTYNYNSTKINRLDSLNYVSSGVPLLGQKFTYTDNNLVSKITQSNDTYNDTLNLIYGPNNLRIKTVLKENGSTLKTKYFLPSYEKEITSTGTRELNYINSPFGLVALIVKQSSTQTVYYVETDHQGSIIGLINPDITYAERYSYDAWGRRRNPSDWTFSNVPQPQIIDRGYTGHEHLDKFNLINMNGRMYDPYLGRFISVDPIIQSSDNSQSFNGYSYCWNNPLIYIDPSGFEKDPCKKGTSFLEKLWIALNRYAQRCEEGNADSQSDPMLFDYYFLYQNGISVGGGDIGTGITWGGGSNYGNSIDGFLSGSMSNFSNSYFENKIKNLIKWGELAETPWVDVAVKEIGNIEAISVPNFPAFDFQFDVPNPKVMRYFKDGGFSKNSITSAWCAIFVNYCVRNAGIKGPSILPENVYSWANWGQSLDRPAFGAITIITGHIGILVGVDNNYLYLLGGNQHDMVNISSYPKSSLLYYRYPSGYVPTYF